MNIANIIKKQTTIIAIVVVLLITLAVGVSYALFYNVKTGETQTVIAGTLKVTFEANGAKDNAFNNKEPMSETEGLETTSITYTPTNTGNLPASYKIYLVLLSDNTVNAANIKFSVDGDQTKGSTATILSSKNSIIVSDSDSKINNQTAYEIDSGTISAPTSGNSQAGTTKYLRVWIDEDSFPDTTDEAQLNLSILVVNEVNENSVPNQAS